MTRARRAPRALLVLAVAVLGSRCGARDAAGGDDRIADEATAYAVQRLALDTLFNGREHASRLVLWATDAGDGPALETLGSVIARPSVPRPVDLTRLAPSLPARVASERELSELFRRHADAWAAFFRENPGAAGLVELAPVRLASNGMVAETFVGRSCGEHCRNTWRVIARRASDGRWRVDRLAWVRGGGG